MFKRIDTLSEKFATAAQHNQANVGVYADVVASGTARHGDRVTVA